MDGVLEYLYNLNRFGIKLGLNEIKKLTNSLDNPQNKFKSIHVAGTNGKGSTAAFIASVLEKSGYKVGLYTSPHLINFNERIKINGREISDQELIRLTKVIRKKAEENKIKTTFFEFTTALAFQYFAEKKVDYAVVEAGMGGRLDATNIINPKVSVITNITADHQKHLGNTKLKIAEEKAGIIKKNSLVITSEKDKKILNMFGDVCKKRNSKLLVLDEYLNAEIMKSNLNGQRFKVSDQSFSIKLPGKHQVRNALTAMLAVNLLGEFSNEDIKNGLKKTRWSGRLQTLKKKPLFLLEGAHNVEGMRNLKELLTELPQRKILVLGISEDKEIQKMVSLIAPLADSIVLSKGNYKPANLDLLEREVKKYCQKVHRCEKVEDAVKKAKNLAKEDDLILATGSLYLVGDVLKHHKLFK